MKFCGDIIITDPCYIIKERKNRPSMNDFPALVGLYCKKFSDFTDEENIAYKEYQKLCAKWEIETPDDYAIADFGSDEAHKEAIKIIGDSPTYPSMTSDFEKWKEEYAKYDELYSEWQRKIFEADNDYRYRNFFKNLGFATFLMNTTYYGDWSCTTFEKDTKKVLGEFCADGGEVCVLLLDEVLKYNPEFDYHIQKPHTTTLIKDFDGDVSLVTTIENGTYEHEGKTTSYSEKVLSVVGTGNINFYTEQTGF